MKRKELGNNQEKVFSLKLHSLHTPVLISSLLLRSVNAGQIDVSCCMKNNQSWVLVLYEVKTSQYPSNVQWGRLKRAQDYLSRVLEMGVKLEVKFCQKAEA